MGPARTVAAGVGQWLHVLGSRSSPLRLLGADVVGEHIDRVAIEVQRDVLKGLVRGGQKTRVRSRSVASPGVARARCA